MLYLGVVILCLTETYQQEFLGDMCILPSSLSFPISLVDFFLLMGAGVPARGITTKESLFQSKETRK